MFGSARPDVSPSHPDYFSQTFDWLLDKLGALGDSAVEVLRNPMDTIGWASTDRQANAPI